MKKCMDWKSLLPPLAVEWRKGGFVLFTAKTGNDGFVHGGQTRAWGHIFSFAKRRAFVSYSAANRGSTWFTKWFFKLSMQAYIDVQGKRLKIHDCWFPWRIFSYSLWAQHHRSGWVSPAFIQNWDCPRCPSTRFIGKVHFCHFIGHSSNLHNALKLTCTVSPGSKDVSHLHFI